MRLVANKPNLYSKPIGLYQVQRWFGAFRKHFSEMMNWRWCAFFNLMSATAMVFWIASEPQFSSPQSEGHPGFTGSLLLFHDCVNRLYGFRFVAMSCLLLTALVSAIAWVSLSLFGRRNDRSILSWLTMTLAVATWLACIGSWQDIGWYGKQQRVSIKLESIRVIAESLQRNWPSQSDTRNDIGPFLAYPTYQPRSLLLMSCQTSFRNGLTFNCVERTPDGGIAFFLTGEEGGDSLEYRPGLDLPSDFTTGLQQKLHVRRVTRLKQGWFLVRYVSGGSDAESVTSKRL